MAGVVLVAGLTFAALAISKRNTSSKCLSVYEAFLKSCTPFIKLIFIFLSACVMNNANEAFHVM